MSHHRRVPARVSSALVGLLLLTLLGLGTGPDASRAQSADGFIRADRLGIAHISASTEDTSDTRYQQALRLGAGWNRWPLYWNAVEWLPDRWNWAEYDRQVTRDLDYDLNINAILLGVPNFYVDGTRIEGLTAPIFDDGSDQPGPGKTINPENPWARYVFETVNRYRPGGVLASERGWSDGRGIRVWEVWNEPDHETFWQGGIPHYARLLKVSYIVAKMADPDAQIMVGGLLYSDGNNWLAQLLSTFSSDPMAVQFNSFFDIVAIHSYAYPWRSGWLTLFVRQTMVEYGTMRPIWLNETGVPVWDDYPGPTWEPTSPRRATLDQQAYYMIQSAVYAWSEGAAKVFVHQLYDDCGDQPAGTDFPPHSGELCTGGRVCAGDAHGMYRNPVGSVCFSQHPYPGTPRPSARAYRLLAEVFGAQPFSDAERQFIDSRAATFTFLRRETNERVTVMWNRTLRDFTFEYPAAGSNAQWLSLTGEGVLTPDDDGLYRIELGAAQPDNYSALEPGDEAGIGGPPIILIEQVGGSLDVPLIDLDAVESDLITLTPPPPQPTPRPTIDPAFDTRPPEVYVAPLPEVSPPTFTVSWAGRDDSGIDYFLVWVRIDGGAWQPWLETSDTTADYTGTSGSVYEFTAWAVDLAGNWSSDTDLRPEATTRVE